MTDISLKFTPEGKFRRFGFVGFESAEQAFEAQAYFDKTFMGTSRLHVEVSKDIHAGEEKARPWSKYSEGSSAYSRLHPEDVIRNRQDTFREKELEVCASVFLEYYLVLLIDSSVLVKSANLKLILR